MGEVLVDEEIEQLGKPLIIFDQHEEGHFSIDKLS